MANSTTATPRQAGRFGTFGGVFTPCVLTILGVIMFLRFDEVVGNAGILQALAIVVAAKLITTITGLSLSAIATNTRTKGGGAYYLISRSLGVEFGGTIGAVFFLAQAISVAMYVLGFTEAFLDAVDQPGWSPVMVGTVTNVLVFASVMIGAGWAITLQYGILAVLLASLASFYAGVPETFSPELLQSNLGSGFAPGENFVTMFALFFPAVTGIMAGANMSGDLKDPARSIPRGTLAAIVFTAAIYLSLAVILGGVASRGDLIGGSRIMTHIAVYPGLIVAGVFAATLSSALGSMMGAPRILQAFARDRIFTVLRPFAVASGRNAEPRRAIIVTFVIAQGCVFLGDLNAIAPVITMAFMITYGTLNLATFYESVTKNPSYRPRFRWCHWSVALSGAVLCGAVMFLISWVWASVAIAVMAALHLYIGKREIQTNWGDVRSGLAFERARKNLWIIETQFSHPKNWRPMVLTMSGAGDTRSHLAVFGHWLTSGHGVQTLGQVIEGELSSMLQRRSNQRDVLKRFIKDRDIDAFSVVVVAESVRDGIASLVQAHGLGGLEPNSILLGWPTNRERWPQFCELIRTVDGLQRNLILAHSATGDETVWSPPQGTIDVWWRGRTNGPLLLLLGHLLTKNPGWRNRRIRLIRIVANEAARDEVVKHLESLAEKARIDADSQALVDDDPVARIHRESANAAIVIFGLELPESPDDDLAAMAGIERLVANLPRAILVRSNGIVELES